MTRADRQRAERREEIQRILDDVVARAGGPDQRSGQLAHNVRPAAGSLPALWRRPGGAMKRIAGVEISLAQTAVHRATERLGWTSIYTQFAQLPEARFEFTEGATPDFAPLSCSCLESEVAVGVATVLTHSTTKHASRWEREMDIGELAVPQDLYAGEFRARLRRLTNRFLYLEADLWWLAAEGGFGNPPPYPVRYESARWLWHPSIAGTAFCLRCGIQIRYRRSGRGEEGASRQAPVCDACYRSGVTDWPAHAVMPHKRGSWWLRCATCDRAFIGSRQARHCRAHRAENLTPSRRRRVER